MKPLLPLWLLFSWLLFLLMSVPQAGAVEETCAACGRSVVATGDFSHMPLAAYENIRNARGREDAFAEEIHGSDFTISISGIEPGSYTIVLGFLDATSRHAGQRVFDVKCGDTTILSNFDIFALAGSGRQAVFTTNQIRQSTESPLALHFIARKGSAKFNTLELKNESGTTIVSINASDLLSEQESAAYSVPEISEPPIWRDPSKPVEARIHDLIRRMSLVEKVRQMRNDAPAIPRLGLPAYNYWSECLHGVGRAGTATVFPQAIGMAATWDQPLLREIADTIATEARAKHNEYVRTHGGNSAQYYGLTFWTPNINIFRDPRWGRGQETYGEDPFLTGCLAVSFIKGLQGDDPRYIKAMACAKHFAVHSGPEPERHHFDAAPSERDFYDTYLPQFEAAVREGHVGAVMGAYNRVYGVPACASPLLLKTLLRDKWGFDGHVVSDCGAIRDIYANHKVAPTAEEASARAVKAGCDLCCGGDYNTLWRAATKGLISEAEIDTALGRLLEARLRLGLFDPPSQVKYAQIPFEENDSPGHRELALRTARESIVLLKNDGLLPLRRSRLKRIAVIGTNAASVRMLLGNYHGTPSHPITILDGIKSAAGPDIEVTYEPGVPLALRRDGQNAEDTNDLAKAVAAAKSADAVIYVGGLDSSLEREEKTVRFEGFAGGDRTRIELAAPQLALLKALYATGKPVVFVNCSGSAIAMPWAAEHLPAIIQAWYPGQAGGRAVADVLFGDYNPAGRLPVTFYRSTADLPPFDDYSMQDRTYRYFEGKPVYAFGYGLSYTRFKYSDGVLEQPLIATNGTLKLSVRVKNTGDKDGEEVVQVYFRHPKEVLEQPRLALCSFKRIAIPRGKTETVSFEIPATRFRRWDSGKQEYVVDAGTYEILAGTASDNLPIRLRATVR